MIIQNPEKDPPKENKRLLAIGVMNNTLTMKMTTLEIVVSWLLENLVR